MFRRFDGSPSEVHPYRRMMQFLMPGRNESAVYFEQTLDLSRTLPWIEQWNRRGEGHATLFQLILHGISSVLHERPRLNRFVAGRRLYDRDGVYISFSAKKRMDDDAPLATVKRRFEPAETFVEMVSSLGAQVGEARSDKKSVIDRELSILLRLPSPVLAATVGLLKRLDAVGLAPRALLESDPMYASAFVANLGSLKIDAAYHHLYEHGNCPLFVAVGQVTKTPWVGNDGVVSARPTVMLRYTYDERIEDGHYCAHALDLLRRRVEDPAMWIGSR